VSKRQERERNRLKITEEYCWMVCEKDRLNFRHRLKSIVDQIEACSSLLINIEASMLTATIFGALRASLREMGRCTAERPERIAPCGSNDGATWNVLANGRNATAAAAEESTRALCSMAMCRKLC